MYLQVLTFPDKRLREKAKPVKEVTKSIQDLARDMLETMYIQSGIGLAAPQVGEKVRLIVVDVAKRAEDGKEEKPDPLFLINPEIKKGDGLIQYEEGCLSCPDLAVLVDRKENIVVGYWDLDGRPCELTANGLKAVCIQHEIDHLNGVLLVDKLSRIKKDLYHKDRLRVLKDEEDAATIL